MGCDDEPGRLVVRHKKGREMNIEQELDEMMKRLAEIVEQFGLRGLVVSENSVTIHGTDDKGDYVMNSPTPGTAYGCLFGGYRFYGGKE